MTVRKNIVLDKRWLEQTSVRTIVIVGQLIRKRFSTKKEKKKKIIKLI
jgi:hypothetical protein